MAKGNGNTRRDIIGKSATDDAFSQGAGLKRGEATSNARHATPAVLTV